MSRRPSGWRCAVCGAERGIAEPMPWRCPNSTPGDHRHVLHVVPGSSLSREGVGDRAFVGERSRVGESSFVSFDGDLAWAAYAAANGMSDVARRAIVDELDLAVTTIAGVGFSSTRFSRSAALSEALGFAVAGGVWVKDDSVNVAGSHKARHLFSILLHLRAAEELGHLSERAPLAIASCGNAALAAAVLARAARWPLDVYVPVWMSEVMGARLAALGANTHRCPRLDDDPPGDPAMLRFREAVEAGAIPFTVQGPENALCLDGGRTVGWEIAVDLDGGPAPDRVFAQVGGGAFAGCLGRGLREAGVEARLHAVQTEGCAPLARAWDRAAGRQGDAALGRDWSDLMTAWDEPHSIADGILDDETYDWLSVFEAMYTSGGRPVVVSEQLVSEAHDLAVGAGFDVSPTGSAGLAGVLAARGELADDERVVVVMTGAAR